MNILTEEQIRKISEEYWIFSNMNVEILRPYLQAQAELTRDEIKGERTKSLLEKEAYLQKEMANLSRPKSGPIEYPYLPDNLRAYFTNHYVKARNYGCFYHGIECGIQIG